MQYFVIEIEMSLSKKNNHEIKKRGWSFRA